MTGSSDGSWLLDTSVVVHVLRATPLGRYLVEQQLFRARQQPALISVVSVGELLSLGRQFGWGEKKLAYLREILSEFVVVDINSDAVLTAYAEIDSWCRQNGFRLGKNDLWIAATANITNSEILTADKDFDPLDRKFITRSYFDPDGEYPPS